MPNKRIKAILLMAAVALGLGLSVPRTAKFAYDYVKGQPWKYDNLYSSFDFPIIKSEEQMIEDRANREDYKIPYYKFSSEITNRSLRQAERLNLGKYKGAVLSELRSIFDKGIIGDDGTQIASELIYVEKDKRAAKRSASDVYRISDAKAKLLSDIMGLGGSFGVDSLFKEQGVYELIVPNLIYDSQNTELVYSESDHSLSPTMGFVSAGELLVSNGELVTSDVCQLLDSYKKEYEASVGLGRPAFLLALGNIILYLAILSALFFIILSVTPAVFSDSRFYYLLLIFVIASVCVLGFSRLNEELLYIVPFTLSSLYLQAFFRPRLIMGVYIVSLLPLLVFTHSGLVPFFIYLISGVVSTYVFNRLNRGWRQFLAAFIVFIVMSTVFMACYMTEIVTHNPLKIIIYLFASSMLNVALYPLVFLFERLFNLVSDSRLAELCDTSHPLIRELEKKAPGTFQHSLQVMNLADAAARSIDANSNMVRAGALYHDIGKLANPQCFIENESLVAKEDSDKYHSSLSPEQSAQDIIKHVTDGVEIARRHHLPKLIINFILSHHGTATVGYFYNRFLNAGGDPEAIKDFSYPGTCPISKEESILMLCDSIEAASRTLTDYSMESVSAFVERIVKAKIDENQFDQAEISISELVSVKTTIKQYLTQMHHERIAYPKRNKIRNNNITKK